MFKWNCTFDLQKHSLLSNGTLIAWSVLKLQREKNENRWYFSRSLFFLLPSHLFKIHSSLISSGCKRMVSHLPVSLFNIYGRIRYGSQHFVPFHRNDTLLFSLAHQTKNCTRNRSKKVPEKNLMIMKTERMKETKKKNIEEQALQAVKQ